MLQRTLMVVAEQSLQRVLAPWMEARAQAGFSVRWLAPARATSLSEAPAAHVVVVGHPQGEGALALPMTRHPPSYRHMKTHCFGDHAWIHGSLAAAPRHAVGRLPARNEAALQRLVEKLTRPTVEVEHRVDFVDGDPLWHPLINRACELIAARAAAVELPDGVTARRASFNPGAGSSLRHDVVPWLSQGGRLFVYVGHGQPDSVDGLQASQLPDDGGAHRAAVLACCHTGTLHADTPGLAEQWLMKSHGPRAILAASNVSDPRLNPAMTLAFVQAALTPGTTVGEALLAARHALAGAPGPWLFSALRMAAPPSLRRAHQGLYNLLGDPTFVVTPARGV